MNNLGAHLVVEYRTFAGLKPLAKEVEPCRAGWDRVYLTDCSGIADYKHPLWQELVRCIIKGITPNAKPD